MHRHSRVRISFFVLAMAFTYVQIASPGVELRCADVCRSEVQVESTYSMGRKAREILGDAIYGAGCNSDRAA